MSKTGLWVGVLAVAAGLLILVRTAKENTSSVAEAKQEHSMQPLQVANLGVHNWHEFTSPNQEFKVLFPTLPQHASEKLEDPKSPREYEMFVSEKDNGSVFMISEITLLGKAKSDSDEAILKKMITQMHEASPNSKLALMKMGDYKGHPAAEFKIESEEINVDGKAILVNNTLYIISTVAKPANYNHDEYEFFSNSFQLIDKQKKE